MRVLYCVYLIFLLCPGSIFAQQEQELDSLKKALISEQRDTIRFSILSDLAFGYANRNTDTALIYANKEMEVAHKINTPRYIGTALSDIAVIQYYRGEFDKALENNQKSLELARQIGNEAMVSGSLNKIAIIYQSIGNYEKATEYQIEVLKIAEKLKNENTIGITLSNISFLYQKTGRYDEARSFLLRAIAIAKKNKDTIHIATAYTNLEFLFEHFGQMDSAIAYEAAAAKLLESIGAKSELAQACSEMGYLLCLVKKNEEAMIYLRKAYKLALELTSKMDEAIYASAMAENFIELKKPDSAFHYFQVARSLYEPEYSPDILKSIYGGLSNYYIFMHNSDSAIKYNNLYKKILDSTYSTTSLKQINELQTRYETEKKEQKIILLDKQNKIKQLTIKSKNIVIVIVLLSLVLMIMLTILLYNRYTLKQESRLKEEIFKQQQLASKAVIAAEELERQRIAVELHDGIGQMFSAVKLNLSGIADRINIADETDKRLLEKTLALVDESCKEVRVISHQMMPNVLLKSGLATAIRDFINKIDESKIKITLETFGLQQPLDSNLESIVYRIIQESVNNVIKHAEATNLDIQLHKDDESITVTIEDNGRGFDLNNINVLEGIGIKNIRARVAYLNGKVDYDTALGKGTLVAIHIPIKA